MVLLPCLGLQLPEAETLLQKELEDTAGIDDMMERFYNRELARYGRAPIPGQVRAPTALSRPKAVALYRLHAGCSGFWRFLANF